MCLKHQSQLAQSSLSCSTASSFSSKVEVLILLFIFLQIYSVVHRDSKVDNFSYYLFFLLIIIRSGFLAGIRWSVCMLKSYRFICESFSRTGAGLCIYHLFVLSNLNFLHISLWITLPTQSCLALYTFCANLLHSLIMWLFVSSLSPHSQHLLFCCVLSILALIWLVLTALFGAAIRRDSVSLLRFPFLSQVQVFWCEMLSLSLLLLLSLLMEMILIAVVSVSGCCCREDKQNNRAKNSGLTWVQLMWKENILCNWLSDSRCQ